MIGNSAWDLVAACPSGKKVLGGGYHWLGTPVLVNEPVADLSGWHVFANLSAAVPRDLQTIVVFATCANVAP